jgi:hypothetical protein
VRRSGGYYSELDLLDSEGIQTEKIVMMEFSFFINRPLLPCGVEGFLLVNLLDNW